ncbi:LLM class flavin-dependent oxidoreductase [Salinadaptatus halalkaliphilus]|uniref:LLM class flavin-dependent oxidoreductase n=1 Tax=Salinadaptatus halalkaliphilus TaxID=2419781 RepID=UPI001580E3A6|nr:LLM class flavin-dependent oxidoreductase [Salinadaptatus halalkaliphilus]
MLEFGGFLAAQSIDDAVEYAQVVEDNGFDALWAIDSQQLYTELYVSLTACAHATERIELAPGITNPVSRHPSVTAGAIAALDAASGGRATLGIGAGDSAVYSIGRTPTTVGELREAVETIGSLLSGETVTVGGEPFTLEPAAGAEDIDICVAAEGPKTLRMAGAVGDAVIFGGGPNPSVVDDLGWTNIRAGAEQAGQDPDDLRLIALAPTCVAESQAAAVELLKPVIEPIAWHNFSFSVAEAPAHLQDDLQRLADAHDMREHGKEDADAIETVPDEVWEYLGDRFAVAGTPEDCRARLERLADVGVDHVMCLFPPDRVEHTERFASEVMEPLQSGE